MSYEIIKNLSLKKQTITYAPNNVVPQIIYKGDYSNVEPKEFITNLLRDLLDGNFKLSMNNQYYYLYDVIEKANVKELNEKYWEHDYSREYTQEERDNEAKEKRKLCEEICKRLYEAYLHYKNTKGNYALKTGEWFIRKIGKELIFLTTTPSKVKKFKTLGHAKAAVHRLNSVRDREYKIYSLDENKYIELEKEEK